MTFKVVPAPGTPAAEFLRLSEAEADLSAREAALLEGGAGAETVARAVQARLDEARELLQRLANGPFHSEAEAAFLRTLAMVVPPHVATPATGAALELRRQALAARESALAAEDLLVQGRLAGLGELERQIGEIRALAAELSARAEQKLARLREEAARQAAPQVFDLTQKKARPATSPAAAPAPTPLGAPKPAPAPTPLGAPKSAAAPAPTPLGAPKPAPSSAPAVQAAQPAAPGPEVRRAPRQRLQTEVSLSSESNFFTGFSGDISETGIFVATYETVLAPGCEVELSLKLPGRPPLKVAGTVRWVREPSERTPGVFPGMGIEFQGLSEQDITIIKDFLHQREPMFWAE